MGLTVGVIVMALCAAAQGIAPTYQFAGYKVLDDDHSLKRPLNSAAVAPIPGSRSESYVFVNGEGKLYRLNHERFRLTEIPLTMPLAEAFVGNLIGVDRAGTLYLADSAGNRVLRITSNGTTTVFAGNGKSTPQGDGGMAVQASFSGPRGTAADVFRNVYIAEDFLVRKVDPAGRVSTFAGAVAKPTPLFYLLVINERKTAASSRTENRFENFPQDFLFSAHSQQEK